MQKCIRRGLERDALFWATELDRSNFGEYVWKRLRIIASEDIGIADPQAA
jgi:replication-associated recombination protein RarA